VYRAATVAQAGLYGLGALGLALADKPLGRRKLLALPAFFCFVNAAALRAAWNLARRRQIDRWEPRRALNWEPVEGQTGVPVRSPE
jgi:hypothetical protein